MGMLIFTVDMGLKFTYLFTSKFVSDFMHSLFIFFIWGRGVFIIGFHLQRLCLETHKIVYNARMKTNGQT